MRAVGGKPCENASIEVLNFLLAEDGAGRASEEEARGGDRAGGRAAGGCTRGYGDDFDESRSAVVFRNWFAVDQQQVCAGVRQRCAKLCFDWVEGGKPRVGRAQASSIQSVRLKDLSFSFSTQSRCPVERISLVSTPRSGLGLRRFECARTAHGRSGTAVWSTIPEPCVCDVLSGTKSPPSTGREGSLVRREAKHLSPARPNTTLRSRGETAQRRLHGVRSTRPPPARPTPPTFLGHCRRLGRSDVQRGRRRGTRPRNRPGALSSPTGQGGAGCGGGQHAVGALLGPFLRAGWGSRAAGEVLVFLFPSVLFCSARGGTPPGLLVVHSCRC